ncbi:hypothetical protein [Sphingomonas azotifigens]|uniref:hypothetical protein n=1 Tax=Sphingomonas azotifigens TaxID=330920 RepID=UPI000A046EA8|nr:hypothetical protein [Sphingomonas azotifigens]
MFVLLAIAAAALPSAGGDICAVGRLALQELPAAPAAGNTERPVDVYVELDPSRSALGRACSTLRESLPPGYKVADDDARARMAVHAPRLSEPHWPRAASIYSIEVYLAPDTRSAIVHVEHSCTGLCGGGTESSYVHTRKGWKLKALPVARWVS